MSLVVSVNVGLPRDVEWQGKVVHTAVWKRPTAGRVMAHRLNLDGDGQGDLAGHGGEHRAVMVYQMGSYRYWERYLQRRDFEYGQFGENLTVEGLEDEDVCIGDRYRIGSALFEVTQPRVTCYRVGIRMNNPQMPALLVSHRRPGFYFRVLQEGEIGAGDKIVKVSEGPERMSVREVDGLLYLPDHSPDRLERALRISALSAGWKSSFEALLHASNERHGGNAGLAPSPAPTPPWAGFRPLRVTAVQRESIDVTSFVFSEPNGGSLPPSLPGQFLSLRLSADKNSPSTVRSYSISGPSDAGTYRISVKRANGVGSRYLHDHIKVGDILQVSAPRGAFTLISGDNPVVLLSAGIGATPVLAMLHTLARSGQGTGREVWWCQGCRNGRGHPFKAEVQSLLKRIPNGHRFIAYSRPDQEDNDYEAVGHLDLPSLQRLSIPKEADFYLCGPGSFVSDLTEGLRSWGVPTARIHSETFGAESAVTPGIQSRPQLSPHQPVGSTGAGPTVSFVRSGLAVPWDARYANLLQFAEACDIPVRWSCRTGVCHMCESGLIDGQVSYAPEPLDRPADGNVLICCSSPLSEVELDL